MLKTLLLIYIFYNYIFSQQNTNLIQNKFIDFELPSISTYNIKLSDLVGKKLILLNFWTTWCPYCKQEIPRLITLANKYKDKNLEIIGINIREPEKMVKKFAENKQINYTIVLDTAAVVAKKYNIKGIPTNFIINKEGNIVFVGPLLPTEEIIIKNLIEFEKKEVETNKKRKKRLKGKTKIVY